MKSNILGKWWFWVIAVIVFLMAISVAFGEDDAENATDAETTTNVETTTSEETETTAVEVENWKDAFSPELVAEIESAFVEIGENPDNIINIEYIDIHTSGYVFEQKCFKVEFSWSLFNPGYKHSRYYRMVTQNYFEGEPEKEQYPNEFLCTIKYWVGDDGHGTNVNQWAWTGNGVKQQ